MARRKSKKDLERRELLDRLQAATDQQKEEQDREKRISDYVLEEFGLLKWRVWKEQRKLKKFEKNK